MRALQSPEILARYGAIGVDPVQPHGPEGYEALLKSEIGRWGNVIRDAHVKVD